MQKIMIIEDEADIRNELAQLLGNEGFMVAILEQTDTAAARINEEKPDLVLLDIGLQGKDGYTLCLEIRRVSQVPIIFVTSRETSIDELKALSVGGDDYITKPYNIPVLIARIKVALRRCGENTAADHIQVKGLVLNTLKGTLEHNGKSVEATKNEVKILACLMQRPGEIISRMNLIEYLWENQIYIDDNTLSVNMTRLRSKLTDLGLKDYIITKRGMGYKV